MIKLIDDTEWPDGDYYAQKALDLGCTRMQAKSLWPLNYGVSSERLMELYWAARVGSKPR